MNLGRTVRLGLLLLGSLLLFTISYVPASAQAPLRSLTANPRIFFDNAQLATMRAQAATTHQEIYTSIEAYATNQLGTVPPALPPGGSGAGFYTNHGNQLITLAFACVISDDPNLCDLAIDHLMAYAGWPEWGPGGERSLAHASMVMGNALAYDWLHPYLTGPQHTAARASLGDRAFELYEASTIGAYNATWDNWWVSSYIQNHYSTIYSALGMAGLVLLNDDVRAPDWVARAVDRMTIFSAFLEGIGDGTWHESIHYQNYMLTYALPFFQNLLDLQGINLFPETYLKNYATWRVYNFLPNGDTALMMYGDLEETFDNSFAPSNALRMVANRYNNGYAEWLAQQIITLDGRDVDEFSTPWYAFEFMYYNPAVVARPPTDLPETRIFPDLQAVIWRTAWDANGLVFGLKAGPYGGNYPFQTFTQQTAPWEAPCTTSGCSFNVAHDHDDAGTFYIFRSGQWLAPETVGVGNVATPFHNTLLIDGAGQFRPPDIDTANTPTNFINRNAALLVASNSRNYGYLAADILPPYNVAGLTRNMRHVVFVNSEYFVMLDDLAADAPHTYEWVSHFGQNVTVTGNWIQGDAGGGQILGVAVAQPDPFTFTTGNDGQPFVRTTGPAPVADTRMIHVLFPTTATEWADRPTVTSLGDTGQAAAVEIVRQDGSACTDTVFMRYADTAGTFSAGPVTTDARAAVATVCASNALANLYVDGGTSATLGGTLLVSGLNAAQPFEVQSAGATVNVFGAINTSVRLLAPQAQQLFVNGISTGFNRDGDYIVFGAGALQEAAAPQTITKRADPPFAGPGDTVDWTIAVANPTGATFTGITVTDVLPGELQIISVDAGSGTSTISGQTVAITLAQLAPGQTATFHITSRVRQNVAVPFAILNQAQLTHAAQPGPELAEASVLSVTSLPTTGESHRTSFQWPMFLLIATGLIAAAYMQLTRG